MAGDNENDNGFDKWAEGVLALYAAKDQADDNLKEYRSQVYAQSGTKFRALLDVIRDDVDELLSPIIDTALESVPELVRSQKSIDVKVKVSESSYLAEHTDIYDDINRSLQAAPFAWDSDIDIPKSAIVQRVKDIVQG